MIRVYQEEHRNLKSLKGKGNKKTSQSQTRFFQEDVTKKKKKEGKKERKKERKIFYVSAWKCGQICTLLLKHGNCPSVNRTLFRSTETRGPLLKHHLISTKWLQVRHDRKEVETLRCLKCKAKE
jgi:hypothetical protein